MKRAIILGGGMVGSAIAMDLKRGGDIAVTVADRRPEVLARTAAAYGVETRVADLGDPRVVREIAGGFDLVVGALPSFLGLAAMQAVIEAGKPYCDISFLAEDPEPLDALARERGVTVVYDAGVAPGLSNMMASWGVAQLDACERIDMCVGGLPAVRRWPFEYKAGFSPIDVLEEYTRPARLVEHGQVVVRPALSEPELLDFPEVGTLEAFNTDGLRSLMRTLPGIPFMRERTLRYPGHIELMRVMRETGLFSKDPIQVGDARVRPLDVTAALLFPKWTFDEGEADLTVMRVSVEGRKGGDNARFSWDLCDRYDPASKLRSMSRTTGFTASIMARFLVEGRFVRPGVHPPEIPAREPGLFDAMLAALAERGVRCTAHVDASRPTR
jgi:saccharopine dehydrogenase-like NADP-dependent oxidoreductase